MKCWPMFVVLTAMAAPAFAGDHFKDRVVQAKKIERSPEGHAYLMRFLPVVNSEMEIAIAECFPERGAGAMDEFELVADIDVEGRITNIETLPATANEKCYSEMVGDIKGPSPDTGKPVPIYISTTVRY